MKNLIKLFGCLFPWSSLTLNETKVALEGITVGGKSLREHFEVIKERNINKTNNMLKCQA